MSAPDSYARLAGVPLEIESYRLERLEKPVTRGFTRVTTVVRLRGRGEEGLGEDVTWYAEHHDREQAAGAVLPLVGPWTLESYSWLELDPTLRFKLDPGSDWTDDLIAELAATDAVVTVDLKAYYRAEDGPPPDADLYRRVAEGFPKAFLEDPALTDETELVLDPHRDRVTWDAPIHSVADVEQLPFPPKTLNSKPSRFGLLRELLQFYDHCDTHGIGLYGGGMFELGPGRGQIQYLASLFHPDGPNDVAPGAYNDPEPKAGLPGSPLVPTPEAAGFRWGFPDA